MKFIPLLILMIAANANAAITVFDAVDVGFYNTAGRSSKNDGKILFASPATFNYSAGAIDEVAPLAGIDVPRRNYFTFDLSGIAPGSITGAAISLFMPMGDGFSSPDPTETYALHAVAPGSPAGMATFASELEAVRSILEVDELAAAVGIFAELAVPGPPLAVTSLSDADEGTFVEIFFTPDGIAYLNTFAGGPVVLGGEVVTLDGVDAGDEVVFGFTAPYIAGVADPLPTYATTPTPSLAVDVEVIPEPACPLMIAVGGLLLAPRRRRR